MIFTAAIQNPTTPEYLCQDFDWHYPTRWRNLDGTWTLVLPVVAADLDDAWHTSPTWHRNATGPLPPTSLRWSRGCSKRACRWSTLQPPQRRPKPANRPSRTARWGFFVARPVASPADRRAPRRLAAAAGAGLRQCGIGATCAAGPAPGLAAWLPFGAALAQGLVGRDERTLSARTSMPPLPALAGLPVRIRPQPATVGRAARSWYNRTTAMEGVRI